MINKYMNNHRIVNLKCPCFLFRYPNLDIPSKALFRLYRASALPLRCGSEDDQNFQSPLGHSRQPIRGRGYCMVPVCHSELQMSECLGPPLSVYSSHLLIYSSPLGIYSWCLLDAIFKGLFKFFPHVTDHFLSLFKHLVTIINRPGVAGAVL